MQAYNTSLLLAAKNAGLATLQALIKSGADIEARNKTVMGIALLGDKATNGPGIWKLMQSILCIQFAMTSWRAC